MTNGFLHPQDCLDLLVEQIPFDHDDATTKMRNYLGLSVGLTTASITGIVAPTPLWVKVGSIVLGSFSSLLTYELAKENSNQKHRKNTPKVDVENVYFQHNGFLKGVTAYEQEHAFRVVPVTTFDQYQEVNPKDRKLVLMNGVAKLRYTRGEEEFEAPDYNSNDHTFFLKDAAITVPSSELMTNRGSQAPITEDFLEKHSHFLVVGEKKSDHLNLRYISPAVREPQDLELKEANTI